MLGAPRGWHGVEESIGLPRVPAALPVSPPTQSMSARFTSAHINNSWQHLSPYQENCQHRRVSKYYCFFFFSTLEYTVIGPVDINLRVIKTLLIKRQIIKLTNGVRHPPSRCHVRWENIPQLCSIFGGKENLIESVVHSIKSLGLSWELCSLKITGWGWLLSRAGAGWVRPIFTGGNSLVKHRECGPGARPLWKGAVCSS